VPQELGKIMDANNSASIKMPAQNKSLQLSAKVVIREVVSLSLQEQVLGF
jgi:hypothetical protein